MHFTPSFGTSRSSKKGRSEMKRRSNQEGSIRKRPDGRWEARLVLGNGERKSLYGQTRQEVTRLLAEAIREREAGITATGDRQTVEQYLTSWLDVITHTVKPRTWQRYEELVRLRIIPPLGATAPRTRRCLRLGLVT